MLAHNQSTGEEEETHLEEVDLKQFGTNDAVYAYDSDDEQNGGQQKVQCRQVSEMLHACILGVVTFISFNDDLTLLR